MTFVPQLIEKTYAGISVYVCIYKSTQGWGILSY